MSSYDVLTGIYDGINCFDCGPNNKLDVEVSKCCPRPIGSKTSEEMLNVKCCPFIYESDNVVKCFKKTKYNTPFFVTGPEGPAKYKNMSNDSSMILRNSFGNIWGRKKPKSRIQRGRWNHSKTNTKLHPVNGILSDNNGNPIGYKQSKNIFKNTDYKMTKKERFAYFSKNRQSLNR